MNSRKRAGVLRTAVALVPLLVGGQSVLATNGTWIKTASGGLWSATANWNSGIVADGIDGIADFSTLNLTAANTVTLDSSRTIGQLKFADITTPLFNWAITPSNSSVLTLSTSTGVPVINVGSAATETATFSGVLSGTQGFSATGIGIVALTGTVNTFTNASRFSVTGGGALQILGDGSLGTAPSSPTAADITLSGGSILNPNLSAAGTFTLNSNRGIALGTGGGFINIFSGKTLSYGGIIADAAGASGSLSTNSVGTVLLTNTSTYTGGTNIGAGTIQIGVNNALPVGTNLAFVDTTFTGSLDLDGHSQSIGNLSDATSVFAHGVTNSVANTTATLTVSGSGTFGSGTGAAAGLIKNGSATAIVGLTKTVGGTLTLISANTYTGPTNITAGTVALSGAGSIANSSAVNISSGAVFDISAATTPSLGTSQTLSGFGNVNGSLNHATGTINPGTIGTAGTLTFNNNLALNGGGLSFDLSAAGNTTGSGINDLISVTGGLALNTATPVSVAFLGTPAVGTTYTVLTAGSETGSGSLVAQQHGYTISNATPGQVTITYVGGPSVANQVWSGATNNQWDVNTTPNWFNTDSSVTDTFFNGDNVTFNDSIGGVPTSVVLAGIVLPGSVTVNSNSNNYNFSSTSSTVGKISGTTALTKLGSSTLTIATALNNYTGVTTLGGGIVNVSALANVNTASSIGSGSVAGSSADLVLNGGTLQYTGSTAQVTNRLLSVGTSGGSIDSSGTATLTFNGTGAIGFAGQTGPRTLTLTGNLGSLSLFNSFSPVIGDNGGPTNVSKTGSGAWVLGGANTYTGTTSVTGGALQITSDSNLGAAPATATAGSIVLDNGTLVDGTNSVVLNSNRGIAVGGGGGTIAVFSGKVLTYGGVIADAPSASGSLTKDSVGTLLLAGSSTYSGATSILNGTLQLGVNNALPVTTSLGFPNGVGTFDLHGFNQSVASLSDNSNTTADVITNTGTTAGTISVDGSNQFFGTIKDGTAKLGLTKIGNGTVTLTQVETYSGPTNITAGTLSLLFGSIKNSTSINISAGATFDISNSILTSSLTSVQTLSGNGSLTGNLDHNAGTINAGTVGTAGTLTFNNNLNLGGGTLTFDLSGTDQTTGSGINDLLTVNGNLAVNQITPISVTVSGGTPTIGSVYRVINAASESGTPADLVVAQRGFAVDNSVSGQVNIIYTGASLVAANLIWNSTSSNSWDVGTSPNWLNTATNGNDKFYSGDNVTFDDTAGVQTSINLTSPLAPGAMVVNSNTNNFTFSGSGKITGTTGVTKAGSSTLTMSTALNDYTGATTINGGTLNVAGLANVGIASSIGAGPSAGSSADLVLNGGTLQYTGSTTQTTNRLFSIGTAGATLDASGTGILNFSGIGALGYNGQSGARTLTLTGNLATTSTLTPVIGDNGGPTSIVKSGAGIWGLAGTNTFSGPVTINGGILLIAGSDLNLGAVPATPTPGSIVLNGGALTDNAAGVTTLSANRGIAIGAGGGGINVNFTKTLAYAGIIANAAGATGALTKDGLGTLTLSGSSTYTGGTTINAGVLKIGTNNALPVGTTLTFNDLQFTNPAATLDLGGFSQTVAGLADNPTALPRVITSTGTGVGTLTVAGGGTYNGSITDGATGQQLALTKNGASTLTLGGAGTYSGDTNINGGTVVLTTTGSISKSTINVNSGATLNLAANTGTGILARTAAGINVNSGGLVTLSPAPNQLNRQYVSVGNVTIAVNGSGSFNGLVDLANNDLNIVSGGTTAVAAVTAAVKQGFNGGGWNGAGGIVSSSAAADSTHLTAIGILLNGNTYGTASGSLGLFDGSNPGSTDVLVKYTYYGDANLDGAVDGSDYTNIDAAFGTSTTGWQNGDFNYDNKIDGSDYTLIDNAFNTQGATLGSNPLSLIATSTASLGGGSAAVPEPASLGILGIAAIGALFRRRRKLNV